MTLDSFLSPSIADENKGCGSTSCGNRSFPKGIHVTEAGVKPDSGMIGVSNGIEGNSLPWGYLFIHNRKAETFKRQVEAYNHQHPDVAHECFIHYSYKYKRNKSGKGVVKQQLPTVSGLVFLQGRTTDLQAFLQEHYPLYHLINDCSTGKPACISHKVMKPFMEVVATHPENVTFLRDPFVKFAKDHTKLRVLTGLFKGLEGYIIRVDRDRQLVMEFGGYAIAIRGVHKEDFEVVE